MQWGQPRCSALHQLRSYFGRLSTVCPSSSLRMKTLDMAHEIWPVSFWKRSEQKAKKVRPQNKAQNRPAQRRLLNLKWFSGTAAAYVLHYAPGPSPSGTTFFAATSAFLLSEVFESTRRSKPSPSKSTHGVCRGSHQGFVVASFVVLSNSAPKRGSRLVNFSDFGRRPRSARIDKLANTQGRRRNPPGLRGRFIRQ
jgi:hypothetical protein